MEVLQLRLHTAQPLPQRAAAAAAAVSCLLHRRQPALQLLHLTDTANAGYLRFKRPLRNTAYLRVLFAVPLNGDLLGVPLGWLPYILCWGGSFAQPPATRQNT